MKPGTLWMWTPVVILTATVAFGAWRWHVAVDDPHHGAVAHPYQDGENWDQHQAEAAARNALAWQSSLDNPAPDLLVLTLKDTQGKAITGLLGTLQGFHNGYPQAIETVPWQEQEDGVYHATVQASRAGLWKWRAQAKDSAWFQDFKLHVAAP